MNKLDIFKSRLIKMAGRKGLLLAKHKPEIYLALGIAGAVGATVLACVATRKVDEILLVHQDQISEVKDAHVNLTKEEYSDMDYKKDLAITYTQTGLAFVKLYGPAITLGLTSVGFILGAHNIMRQRNVAIAAAYKLVEQSFRDYRRRVVEEYGEEKDRQFKYGIREEKVTVIEEGEDGKKKKVQKTVSTIDPNAYSQYARFFDESNENWSKTPEYSLLFLKGQQNYMNNKLHACGHLFLNEVYDALGMERTQEGAVVGWIVSKEGDNFVDFHIYDMDNVARRNFVNGYERSILLDFNVDGVIFDLI